MCGRYAIAPTSGDAWATMGDILGKDIELMLAEQKARYNIAPSTQIPIIVQDPETRQIVPVIARWGFIPHWWKEINPPKFSTINARSEEAEKKPMWREAFKTSRCLIPATHWYEWQETAAGKQPHALTSPNGKGFMFAGLFSRWKPPNADEAIYTAAILTRDASSSVSEVHDRMPVILNPSAWTRWLDPSLAAGWIAKEILQVSAVLEARTWEISKYVNNPVNQGPEALAPLKLN